MLQIGNKKYLANLILDLSSTKLKEIPTKIADLHQLQIFVLPYNRITKIPKEIGDLQQLQKLDLHSNLLTQIPKEIGNLRQLQKLDLCCNQLTQIPQEIGNLQQLQELNLCFNQLTQIPKGPPCLPQEIGNLQQLRTLNLSFNQIIEIPKEIGNLQQLQKLFLFNNKLTKIPEEIGNLSALQILFLENNQLIEIPKEIGNLQQLQKLYLYNNKLAKIPEEIGNLQELQTLNLHDNQLAVIPKEIGNLQQLQILNISMNQLIQIPISIIYLPRLCILDISNNPIENLHPAINRFLQRQKNSQNIYNDKQSVHNHNIEFTTNKSVIDFISNYQCKQTDIDEILKGLNISSSIKNILLNYCQDDYIHSKLQLKYTEILLPVLDFIKNSNHKEELLQILHQEILDSEGKCFQGRISRTINILNGYSEFVNINISDNEQIGNLIINLKNKYSNDFTKLKEQFILEMKERNYTDDIINEWINYIQENY